VATPGAAATHAGPDGDAGNPRAAGSAGPGGAVRVTRTSRARPSSGLPVSWYGEPVRYQEPPRPRPGPAEFPRPHQTARVSPARRTRPVNSPGRIRPASSRATPMTGPRAHQTGEFPRPPRPNRASSPAPHQTVSSLRTHAHQTGEFARPRGYSQAPASPRRPARASTMYQDPARLPVTPAAISPPAYAGSPGLPGGRRPSPALARVYPGRRAAGWRGRPRRWGGGGGGGAKKTAGAAAAPPTRTADPRVAGTAHPDLAPPAGRRPVSRARRPVRRGRLSHLRLPRASSPAVGYPRPAHPRPAIPPRVRRRQASGRPASGTRLAGGDEGRLRPPRRAGHGDDPGSAAPGCTRRTPAAAAHPPTKPTPAPAAHRLYETDAGTRAHPPTKPTPAPAEHRPMRPTPAAARTGVLHRSGHPPRPGLRRRPRREQGWGQGWGRAGSKPAPRVGMGSKRTTRGPGAAPRRRRDSHAAALHRGPHHRPADRTCCSGWPAWPCPSRCGGSTRRRSSTPVRS
jgi:hypothetical protein